MEQKICGRPIHGMWDVKEAGRPCRNRVDDQDPKIGGCRFHLSEAEYEYLDKRRNERARLREEEQDAVAYLIKMNERRQRRAANKKK